MSPPRRATARHGVHVLSESGWEEATGVLERFRERGALMEGHFLLSSGLHSPIYFQSALLLQHPADAEALARSLAGKLAKLTGGAGAEGGVDAVVGPALGAVVVAHELARALGCRALFTEREGGETTLRRGFELEEGERVVVCEDVVTTGGSAAEVVSVVRAAGAQVVALAALVHRGRADVDFGAPLAALARLEVPTFRPDVCPGCAAGAPLVKPGSRGTKRPTLK